MAKAALSQAPTAAATVARHRKGGTLARHWNGFCPINLWRPTCGVRRDAFCRDVGVRRHLHDVAPSVAADAVNARYD